MTKRVTYTVDVVAAVLRCHPNHIRRLAGDGRLAKVPNMGKRLFFTAAAVAEAFELDIDAVRVLLDEAADRLELERGAA